MTIPQSASSSPLPLSALAENLRADALPAQPEIVARDSANGVILQEMAATWTSWPAAKRLRCRPGKREKAPLLLPDAWTNPTYLHFALKTLLATLLCYVFYNRRRTGRVSTPLC
ncbi:multidrug efflux system protein MdtO [Raoultella terrigena]|uniref:Multidrug efflux system protein MdtO n=1 Tax=Raoultella terrigena TaxID=577 RepID=A0A4U9D6W7_RAOTE|nr:multidrug efflux system protein MdtO [Raoultella terrigena]